MPSLTSSFRRAASTALFALVVTSGPTLALAQATSRPAPTSQPVPTDTTGPVPAVTQIPAVAPRLPHRSGLRLTDFAIHDPWILHHAATETYYLYTSAPARQTGFDRFGTMAYKSKDLKSWEGPVVVFLIPDGIWANPLHGSWAPEVHEYRGKYYLFTTLHNNDAIYATPPETFRFPTHARATIIAVADGPEGPFKLVSKNPVTPDKFMTLDGTLFVDEQQRPWMVYAHEWTQLLDGAMEAIPLRADLSAADGDPIHLFKASDAPWLNKGLKPDINPRVYVTDGPEFYRTRTGRLLMLWSSYAPASENGKYVETLAASESGTLQGPWKQLETLPLGEDSGHGMLFHTPQGALMLVVHQPFKNARAKLYEMEDTGDSLRVIRQRKDLDNTP